MGWLPTPKAMRTLVLKTLPGLSNFYMAGQWVAPGGGVPPCLYSGRHIIQILCRKDGKRFSPVSPDRQISPASGLRLQFINRVLGVLFDIRSLALQQRFNGGNDVFIGDHRQGAAGVADHIGVGVSEQGQYGRHRRR